MKSNEGRLAGDSVVLQARRLGGCWRRVRAIFAISSSVPGF